MISTQILSNLPEEVRWPMAQLVKQMREDLAQTVTKQDIRVSQLRYGRKFTFLKWL